MAKTSHDFDAAAVRDLSTLGESGAFGFLLEPDAEQRMWECCGRDYDRDFDAIARFTE
jgi:hypothetical protein